MQRRILGGSGIEIPAIVFGAYPLGGTNWGARDDEEALRALRAAFDAGMTAVDTAPVYGFGVSEGLVGRAIAGRSDGIVVMTKVGLRWDQNHGRKAFTVPTEGGKLRTVRHDGRPASVRAEVEASLIRLNVECIDLIQLHAPDPDVAPEESLGALDEMRAEGKLRAVGSSNLSIDQMRAAHTALQPTGLASEQLHFSLLTRAAEQDRLPWALENGVGVLAYSPLDQGLLAGAVPAERRFPKGDKRTARWTFSPENRSLVNGVIDTVVRPIARAHDATVGQVVVAWTLARPGISAVLVGARRIEHALENARAGALVLSGDEHTAIDTAFRGLPLVRRTPSVWSRGVASIRQRLSRS
ncbi:MAG: methylglyoxal reductase [Planctomycetota bacterium]